MKIEFDRDTCIGMFQSVNEWDGLGKGLDAGKADLLNSKETDGDISSLKYPMARSSTPSTQLVSAQSMRFRVYDNNGEQII